MKFRLMCNTSPCDFRHRNISPESIESLIVDHMKKEPEHETVTVRRDRGGV